MCEGGCERERKASNKEIQAEKKQNKLPRQCMLPFSLAI
jgi:hypothetical protein